jgi:hypothetical protein
MVHSARLLTDSLIISEVVSLIMEGYDIKNPHRILQVINYSNFSFCFYFYKMGVQIKPTNCAMDLTGLLFVPCTVTQITDIHLFRALWHKSQTYICSVHCDTNHRHTFVPCTVTQITDIHYPWERRCSAETCSTANVHGDLWFYTNCVLLVVCVCVIVLWSSSAVANEQIFEGERMGNCEGRRKK